MVVVQRWRPTARSWVFACEREVQRLANLRDARTRSALSDVRAEEKILQCQRAMRTLNNAVRRRVNDILS